jgi:hypothetical protein
VAVEAAVPNDTIVEINGHNFACTGVGARAQHDPAWDKFPVKMVFTNADGDYLGDVAVKLRDKGGRTVVQARCLAPWFMADLDPGRYTAEVAAPGAPEQSVNFRVDGRQQSRVVVRFTSINDT